MSILFLIPYVPIPRIIKRIEIAATINDVTLIYWDRGTDVRDNVKLPANVSEHIIKIRANEGNPMKRVGATFKFLSKSILIIKKTKPNCIHTTKTDMLILIWIYCKIVKIKPKVIYEISDIHKIFLNDDNSIISSIIKKILYFLESNALKIVDILIVTSQYFWTEVYHKWIPEQKVIFIPNTPDELIFENFRKKEGGNFKIGFIGKIRYFDQLKLLIDVANKVGIEVLIAGNGVDLDKITSYCQFMKNIEVIGAYDYNKDISRLYSKVDAIYSVYDTSIKNVKIALPNRLYEAALCEIPLIVSKNTELSKIVYAENLGEVVSDIYPDELETAINKLMNEQYRSHISKNCKDFYRKWKYETVKKNLAEIYISMDKDLEEQNDNI